jgi:hypothetical protein
VPAILVQLPPGRNEVLSLLPSLFSLPDRRKQTAYRKSSEKRGPQTLEIRSLRNFLPPNCHWIFPLVALMVIPPRHPRQEGGAEDDEGGEVIETGPDRIDLDRLFPHANRTQDKLTLIRKKIRPSIKRKH